MKTSLICVELALIGIVALSIVPKCAAVTANGSETNNPYADIAERNVFRLKTPRNDIKQEEPPKAPVNIKLTGFEKRGAEGTRVLMAEAPKDPKQPWRYYNLGVGEEDGGVEV